MSQDYLGLCQTWMGCCEATLPELTEIGTWIGLRQECAEGRNRTGKAKSGTVRRWGQDLRLCRSLGQERQADCTAHS